MSVRVRYRLTNYHCPSSLHPSLPPSFSHCSALLQLCHLLLSPPLWDLVLSPFLLSPAVTSTSVVVTGTEERTNREDLSQKLKEKKTPKGEEKLWLVLSDCDWWFVCLFQVFWDLLSLCFWGTCHWRHRGRWEPDTLQKSGGRWVSDKWRKKNRRWRFNFASHHPAGQLKTLGLVFLLWQFCCERASWGTLCVFSPGGLKARTHAHRHSGYLEGHFFSWSSDHTDPADCCNLHCKVTGWGLDVYLRLCVCVSVHLMSPQVTVCVCFKKLVEQGASQPWVSCCCTNTI